MKNWRAHQQQANVKQNPTLSHQKHSSRFFYGVHHTPFITSFSSLSLYPSQHSSPKLTSIDRRHFFERCQSIKCCCKYIQCSKMGVPWWENIGNWFVHSSWIVSFFDNLIASTCFRTNLDFSNPLEFISFHGSRINFHKYETHHRPSVANCIVPTQFWIRWKSHR